MFWIFSFFIAFPTLGTLYPMVIFYVFCCRKVLHFISSLFRFLAFRFFNVIFILVFKDRFSEDVFNTVITGISCSRCHAHLPHLTSKHKIHALFGLRCLGSVKWWLIVLSMTLTLTWILLFFFLAFHHWCLFIMFHHRIHHNIIGNNASKRRFHDIHQISLRNSREVATLRLVLGPYFTFTHILTKHTSKLSTNSLSMVLRLFLEFH